MLVGAYECRIDGGRIGRKELRHQLILDEIGCCIMRSEGEGFVGMLETLSFRGRWTHNAKESTVELHMTSDCRGFAQCGADMRRDAPRDAEGCPLRYEERPRDGSYEGPPVVKEILQYDKATTSLVDQSGHQYLKQTKFQLMQHPDDHYRNMQLRERRMKLEEKIEYLQDELARKEGLLESLVQALSSNPKAPELTKGSGELCPVEVASSSAACRADIDNVIEDEPAEADLAETAKVTASGKPRRKGYRQRKAKKKYWKAVQKSTFSGFD